MAPAPLTPGNRLEIQPFRTVCSTQCSSVVTTSRPDKHVFNARLFWCLPACRYEDKYGPPHRHYDGPSHGPGRKGYYHDGPEHKYSRCAPGE